jgi:hypothetical protein
MALSGVSAPSTYAASQQVQPPTQQKHRPSISEVDMQSASAASALSPTGKTGHKVDITA